MPDTLVAALIQAARRNRDEETRIIITPKGDGEGTYVGRIDLRQSNDTTLTLHPIDGERSASSPGPTYRFLRECIKHVAYAGDVDGEASYWFIIDGNHSLTGVRITSDEFYRINDRRNGGGWPAGFTHDDPEIYVYLKAVTFEYYVASQDYSISLDEINCCGDVW